MSSPTQRTLKLLRDAGYTAAVVERWQAHAHKRVDLFGFLDLVAIKGDLQGVLGVQATSGSNVAARLTKIGEISAAVDWLLAGNRLAVIGWRKVTAKLKSGKKAKRKPWSPRIVRVWLDGVELKACEAEAI